MNEEFILKLIEKFNQGTAVSLKVTVGDTSVQLKKAEACKSSAASALVLPPMQAPAGGFPAVASASAPVSAAPQTSAEGAPASSAQSEEKAGDIIRSPIVATFYRSPSPDAPSYVEIGSKVEKGQPLCILEAMKMLNNLEADFPCVIEKILVANGDLVEYDQPLFQVRKI